jgi:hypothetical protein
MIAVRYDFPGGHGKTEVAYSISVLAQLRKGIPIRDRELLITRYDVADVAE